MKKLLYSIALACAVLCTAHAQEDAPAMDDAARIAISAYMDPSSEISAKAKKVMVDKIQKIISKNGLGATKGNRFIVTANIREINLEKSETAPVIYFFTLEANFYLGDGIDGTLFSSCSMEVKGAGESKDKAYMDALKKIKVTDPMFKGFLEKGKTRIVEYFTAKCDFIITQAQTKAKNQQYDAALHELMQVPDVCKECFDKCMAAAQPVYQDKINTEGAQLLAAARSVWTAGQTPEAAEEAGSFLAQINPSSTSYAAAEKLSAEIAKRVKELDQREWDFMLKQQQDEVDLQKAEIKAIRDIGVAYGENQQPTYNILWW